MLTFGEIWNYVRVMLRWWWVLVLATTMSAGVAFVLTAREPKYYVARTTIMVGDTLNSPTPDAQLIGISTALASFYAEMARREPILGPVTERLGLEFPWQVIANYMLKTGVNRQASLLDLSVTDTSPERAAAIATAIAEELVRYSPNSPEKVAAQRALISEQLTQAEGSLESIERNLEEARALQAQATGAADLREMRSRLQELENSRQSAQATYNQLVRLQNSSVVNSLNIVEPAQIPTSPLPSKARLMVALAAAGGLALAIVAVFLLELIDDRWRGAGDLSTRLGLATLGLVPGRKPLFRLGAQALRARELAVREAHTQIVLAGANPNKRTIMVSSAHPQEGRSALVVDLAQLFTRSGYRVLLVDADTEDSQLTRMLGSTDEAAKPVIFVNGEAEIWSNLQPTPLKNVMLLAHNQGPDGRPLPPSLPWPALVESLSQAADVIIFDGPSAMDGVDAALLAPLVDGVILTVDPASDQRAEVTQSKARLGRTEAGRLLGAVVISSEHGFEPPQPVVPWLPPAIARLLLGPGPARPAEGAQLDVATDTSERVIVTPQFDNDLVPSLITDPAHILTSSQAPADKSEAELMSKAMNEPTSGGQQA